MKHQHNIKLDIIRNVPVIYIEGDLTSDADRDAKGVYSSLKEKHSTRKVIINFEKTTYINSAGIATLIYIIQDLKKLGGGVAFVGMTDHLENVMEIVGISDFIKAYRSNDEALSAP